MSNIKQCLTSLLLALLLMSAVIWMIVSVDRQQVTFAPVNASSRRWRRYSFSKFIPTKFKWFHFKILKFKSDILYQGATGGDYNRRVTVRPRPIPNSAVLTTSPSSRWTKRPPQVDRYGLDYYYSKGMYGDYNHHPSKSTNAYNSASYYGGSSNEFKKLALIVLVPLALCLVLFILLSFATVIKSLGYYLSNYNYTAINGTYYYSKWNGLFGGGLFGGFGGGNRGVVIPQQQQQQQSSSNNNNNNANNINDVIIIYHWNTSIFIQ